MHAQENKLLLSSQPSITFTSRSPKFPLFFPAIQMAENNSRPRSKRSSTGNSATSRRTTISFCQTLTSGPGPKLNNKIEILVAKEDTLRRSDFAIFDHIRPIGISIGYKDGGSGRVLAIALVDDCNGMVFEFSTKKKTGDGRKLLEELVLCRESGVLVAFDMGPLILSLYSEFNLLVCKAVDLQSAFNPDDPGRSEFDTIKAVIGEVAAPDLKRTNIEKVFRSQKYDPETKHSKLDLVARAWAAQFTVDGIEDLGDPEKMRAINLQGWDEEKLKLVAKIATDAIRLDNIKPGETQHQFEGVSRGEDNSLRANAASYNHKFRGQKLLSMALAASSTQKESSLAATVALEL
ncbi:hypothetical protein BKA70DRAFT_719029 [Coprinopsis sp. MPI-PUGE-AT-0042]|nr:hypothetical protein BKA70DRAFT_719029 [Coprinopsis sp. MPI-PUGE-AT-0042]